jgi:hypothetical protein
MTRIEPIVIATTLSAGDHLMRRHYGAAAGRGRAED